MLSDKQKLTLMWMLLKPVLIVSGLASISALGSLALVGVEALAATAVILTFTKVITLALCILLFLSMHNKSTKFFYINLGVPVKKLILMAVTLDMSLFFAGMILILALRYGIN